MRYQRLSIAAVIVFLVAASLAIWFTLPKRTSILDGPVADPPTEDPIVRLNNDRPPDNENAALLYAAAVARLPAAPARLIHRSRDEQDERLVAEVAVWAEACKPSFDLVREAARRPSFWVECVRNRSGEI